MSPVERADTEREIVIAERLRRVERQVAVLVERRSKPIARRLRAPAPRAAITSTKLHAAPETPRTSIRHVMPPIVITIRAAVATAASSAAG